MPLIILGKCHYCRKKISSDEDVGAEIIYYIHNDKTKGIDYSNEFCSRECLIKHLRGKKK